MENLKDWGGNRKTTYAQLGATNHTLEEREINDYYATDPKAIDILINECAPELNQYVWECACGEGHLSEKLKEYGYNVYSSDKVARGYGDIIDFLTVSEAAKWNCDIVTNPPYKYASEFIEKAMQLLTKGNKAYFFLKLLFLESKTRKELFKKYPPKTVYVLSGRVICAKNGDFENYSSSAGAYAWYEFEAGYQGKTTIKWVN